MHFQAVVVFLLSLFVLVPSGKSQDSSESVPTAEAETVAAKARAHFERGVEHYSEGNYDAALAEFQRAYELSPTHKLLFNLAQVQMERRDYAAALHLLTDYLRIGGTDIAPERVTAVEQDIVRLKKNVGELSLDVDVQGAQIFVNAAPMGVSPVLAPLPVNVGSALVRVEKAGYAPFAQSVSVAGGDIKRLVVVLAPLTAAAAAPVRPIGVRKLAPPLELQTVPNMTPAWISLGAALVLGGTTAAFGVLSLNASERQDALLMSYPGRSGELDAARDRLQTFAVLTDVFGASTLAAGLVGLYFLWSPPERRVRPELRVTATPTGITLAGAF